MRLPSTNPITLPYGAISQPYSVTNPHAGTDYSHSPDPYSYAPERVTVVDKRPTNECGNLLDLKSSDGTRIYRLCHSAEIYVNLGQVVAEGAKIAKMGNTGNASGVHLHFVMWVNGVRVDPDKTIKSMIGGNMAIERGRAIRLLRIYLHGNPVESQILKVVKQNEDPWLDALRNDATFKDQTAKIKGYDALLKENAALKAQLASGYEQITEPLYRKKS